MHIRTARGLDRAVETIKSLQLDTVQIFTGNPSAWRSAPIDSGATSLFRESLSELDVQPILAHAMYLINLAAANPSFYAKSKEALSAELVRAEAYGCTYVVTHIGSHGGDGRERGIERIVAALDHALLRVTNSVVCLLENSAGGGDYVGARFEDLTEILGALPQHAARLGVAFDTAHAYASGYDDGGATGMQATLDALLRAVSPERIRACHCNDTTVPCGGKADRHHHIGQGHIGLEGFRTLLAHPSLEHCAFVLETPGEDLLEGRDNLQALRALL